MKELLTLIISIIILIILFELFCSSTKLSGFVKFAFSSLIVFSVAVFLVQTLNNYSFSGSAFEAESTENEQLIYEQVEYLEGIIETRIKLETDLESDVRILYEEDGDGDLNYLGIDVYLELASDEEIKEIKEIVSEYLDCQVNVYV